MSRRLTLLVLAVILLLAGNTYAQEEWEHDFDEDIPVMETAVVRGRVLEVSPIEDIPDDWFFIGRQLVLVEVTEGRFRGQTRELEYLLTGIEYRDLNLRAGDQILLLLEMDADVLVEINIFDMVRDRYLYILVAAFAVGLVLVARMKGLKALLTLVFMGVVIVYMLLPLILQGYDPILLTLVFASLITFFTLIVIGGFNTKTLAAIGGTLGGLAVAGIIAWIFGNAAHLTGFSSEEAQYLQYADVPQLNIRGLLFAGIIIGSLGAVLDVAMSIASAVTEIKAANPLLSARGLFQAGYNVGKDILGTMVNTLILAYTGGALPLLLLFMALDLEYTRIINLDQIATEVVRSLAGSFGLLTAVPLTAILAAFLMDRFGGKKAKAK